MKESKLRAAVIGAGRIANDAHIPALKALAGRVELTAICSRRAENAKAMAKTHGFSHWYTDCEKMFKEQRIDLACICTPNQSHGPLSKLALECGAHVICEKPLSICAAEAEALYQCANDHHRSLVACQNMRYDPSIGLAHNLVEQGELGDIYYATFTYLRRRGIPDWGGFHRKADNGGGCMCDLGVHQLDALLWILGNPRFESVTGFAATHIGNRKSPSKDDNKPSSPDGKVPHRFHPSEMDVEEFAAGSIVLENGCRIDFKTSWAVNLPDERNIRLAGTRAGLCLPEDTVFSEHAGHQADIHFPTTAEARLWNSGHCDLILDVVDHVQFGCPLPIKPEETLNVTRILDAFYRSVVEHREIRANEIQ